MEDELVSAIITIIIIGFSRWLSSREHKKSERISRENGRQITEIHLMINGELEKKIEQAREEGRQEVLNKRDKTL